MTVRTLTAVALLLATAACNRAAPANNAAPAANTAAPAQTPAPPANASKAPETAAPTDNPRNISESKAEGCAGEIGNAEARELVAQCLEVSPATRPPCNVANSCEMIQDEIERSCELLGEDAPALCHQ